MKDESMVEVLARAIYQRRAGHVGNDSPLAFGALQPSARELLQDEARACLQALLDHGPTREMVDGGIEAEFSFGNDEDRYATSTELIVREVFRAMISKALGEVR